MALIGMALGLVFLVLVATIVGISWKVIKLLLVNALTGAVLLWIFNLFGSLVGLQADISFLNALVAGVFGIPGVVLILLIQA